MEFEQALQVLELSSGCSFHDAKKSYKDLVQVWHSDRHRHNDRLVEKAKQKMQILNEAWSLISSLGEAEFNERLKKKHERASFADERRRQAASAEKEHPRPYGSPPPSESSKRYNLKSYQATGILLTPIWHIRQQQAHFRTGFRKRVQLVVAVALLLSGLFMAPRLYRQIQFNLTGKATNAQIVTCGNAGEKSTVRIDGDEVSFNIPRSMLRIAMSKQGDVLYSCPQYFSVIYSKSLPEMTRIGGSIWVLWIPLLAQFFGFAFLPLLLIRQLRKTQD